MTELLALFFVLQYSRLYESHGLENALVVFFGSQCLQRLFFGNLNVDTHAICPSAGLVEQLLGSTGDGFQMDVAIEAVNGAQVADDGCQTLHRVVGIAHDATRQKQPFDVVTPIELHRDFL